MHPLLALQSRNTFGSFLEPINLSPMMVFLMQAGLNPDHPDVILRMGDLYLQGKFNKETLKTMKVEEKLMAHYGLTLEELRLEKDIYLGKKVRPAPTEVKTIIAQKSEPAPFVPVQNPLELITQSYQVPKRSTTDNNKDALLLGAAGLGIVALLILL